MTRTLVGKTVCERYEVLSLIGAGGMGTVYKGRHQLLNQMVALKVFQGRFEEVSLIQRFQREAKILAGLSHPNIVQFRDFGIGPDDEPILVMEFCSGSNLSQVITENEGGLSVARSLYILMQICDALDYAHSKGIIHRDLKPSNILLLETDGDKDLVKILDFGIAKMAGLDADSNLTKTGDVLGSPAYMSPEQCLGRALDKRSDIYALGCVMYEMFTGRTAISGSNSLALLHNQVTEIPHSFYEVGERQRQVPNSIESVVFKALAKDPNERYQDMRELKSDLAEASKNPAFKAGLTTASLPNIAPQSLKRAGLSNNYVGLGLAAVAVVAVGAGAFYFSSSNKSATTSVTSKSVTSSSKNSTSVTGSTDASTVDSGTDTSTDAPSEAKSQELAMKVALANTNAEELIDEAKLDEARSTLMETYEELKLKEPLPRNFGVLLTTYKNCCARAGKSEDADKFFAYELVKAKGHEDLVAALNRAKDAVVDIAAAPPCAVPSGAKIEAKPPSSDDAVKHADVKSKKLTNVTAVSSPSHSSEAVTDASKGSDNPHATPVATTSTTGGSIADTQDNGARKSASADSGVPAGNGVFSGNLGKEDGGKGELAEVRKQLASCKDPAKCIDLLTQALTLAESINQCDGHYYKDNVEQLAALYAAKKDWRAQEDLYKRFLDNYSKNPNADPNISAVARGHLAFAYRNDKNTEQAIIDYNKALAQMPVRPNNFMQRADMHRRLGAACGDAHRFDDALSQAKEAEAIFSNANKQTELLGAREDILQYQVGLKNYAEAIDCGKKCLQATEDLQYSNRMETGWIYERLATAYWKTNRADDAKQFAQKSVDFWQQKNRPDRVKFAQNILDKLQPRTN